MIAVRPATTADLPVLVEFWYEKWTLLSQSDARVRLLPDGRAAWQAAAKTWLHDERTALYTVTDEQHPVGYALGWIDPLFWAGLQPIGVIVDIALDAHAPHIGAARALVEALRTHFAAQGMTQILVWTARQQPVEQAFWRALGAIDWMDGLWLKR
jgi:ribosomal protein S18 acetylase RimI-like enzyme